MNADDWNATEAAFAEASALRPEAREAFLSELRVRDAARAQAVERLLLADDTPHILFGDDARADLFRDGLQHLTIDALRQRVAPDLAGRYELGESLGQGGMAVVFAADEHKHQRRVAVKVMRPEVAGRVDPRRFGLEVRLTAQLTHPHVVPLYDSGEAGGLPYYVTAAVPGESLADRLEREGAMDPEDVREVVRGLAEALDYAHARRILHRDVKPSNVLLHGRLALLADFGIGKALAADDVSLTSVGGLLGTLRYMSPEALRGETVDARADVYALALVAYEALTGRPAFQGETAFAIAESHGAGPPPAPSTLRATLPHALDSVFQRGLAEAPEKRLESAGAFAEMLDAALSGAPARPPAKVTSVAVLPFDNRAPGGDGAFLSEGISEQLIIQLGTVPDLRVVARASSSAASASAASPREAARLLGVRHVVTGSVRRQGDRLRIAAELMDAQTGFGEWSARYDRQLTDVFEIEDEIARAVADALRARLAPASPTERVTDIRAYQHYLRARHGVFSFTASGLAEALEDLDRALAILPESVPVLAAKGYVHWQHVNAGIDPDPAHLDHALSLADRISALRPGSHHADRLRGLAAIHQGRPDDAIVHLERTLEANPTDTDAALWLALLLGFRGQPHRVQPHVTMLVETDPLNPLHQMLPGFLALMRGHTASAPEPFRKALAMAPENPVLRLGCGQAEAMAGDHEGARATLAPLDQHAPGSLFAGLGRLLRRGLGENVPGLAEAESEAAQGDMQWCWTAAQGHAMSGEHEKAMEWMRRALAIGFANYPLLALYDPLLHSLRGAPSFDDLLREVHEAWSAHLPGASRAA